MRLLDAVRNLLDRLRDPDEANLERDVEAAEYARRRGPNVVDASEGVPPVPYEPGGGGVSL